MTELPLTQLKTTETIFLYANTGVVGLGERTLSGNICFY